MNIILTIVILLVASCTVEAGTRKTDKFVGYNNVVYRYDFGGCNTINGKLVDCGPYYGKRTRNLVEIHVPRDDCYQKMREAMKAMDAYHVRQEFNIEWFKLMKEKWDATVKECVTPQDIAKVQAWRER